MGMGPIFDDWNGNGNGNLTMPTTAEIILYLHTGHKVGNLENRFFVFLSFNTCFVHGTKLIFK